MEPIQSTLSRSNQLKLKSKQKPETQSINQLYQEQEGSECNYCHKGKSYSWGLVSANYEPYTYQTMMQRGWRRCGTYYYKPDLQRSCCKQWTHRLDVNDFRVKRDQKKTIKRMMAWCYEPVVQIQEEKPEVKNPKSRKNSNGQNKFKKQQQKSKQQNHNQNKLKEKDQPKSTKMITELCQKTQEFIKDICQRLNNAIKTKIQLLVPAQKLNPQNLTKEWNFEFLDKLKSFPSKPEEKSDYYCNWGMLLYGVNKSKMAKEFSLIDFVKIVKDDVQKVQLSQQYSVKLQRGGYLLIELSQKLKEDKQFQIIKQVKDQIIHKEPTKMQAQNPGTEVEQQRVKFSKQVPETKKQMELEQPKIKKQESSNQFQKLEPQFQGELTITTDLITFGKMKIHLVEAEENTESWKMYQRYCCQIHGKEEKGLSSYTNFLCEKALTFGKQQKTIKDQQKWYLPAFDPAQTHQRKKQVTGPLTKRQGCYHMKYYLQDKFIAVGVIDLLPHGLSSVYFFYQPQYKDHRLGVFSSLIEIQYIRYLSLTFPQFKYYYMGFYIHDNDKMTYKGDYGPFQLLCPITYNFVTIDERAWGVINRVVRQGDKNIRLAPQNMPKDPDMQFSGDLGLYIDKNIKLTYRRRPLKLKDINPEFYLPVLMILKSYLGVFGKEVFEMLTFTF